MLIKYIKYLGETQGEIMSKINKKISMLIVLILCLTVASFVLVACKASNKEKVYLITMDGTDEHWVRVHKGAKEAYDAATDKNFDFEWSTPTEGNGTNDKQQIALIEQATANNAKVIILAAAVSPDATANAVKEAIGNGVKFIYVDSPASVTGDGIIQTVKTDNEAGGYQGGKELVKRLKESSKEEELKGKTIQIYLPDATAGVLSRAAGFKKAVEEDEFKTQQEESGKEPKDTQDKANALITDDSIVAFYGVNEGTTVGIGNAIKENKGTTKVGAGFDASSNIDSHLKDGSLLFTVQQQPDVMGKTTMATAIKFMNGEDMSSINKDVATETVIHDKDNLRVSNMHLSSTNNFWYALPIRKDVA